MENLGKSGESSDPENDKSDFFRQTCGNFGPKTRFPRSPNRAASFGMLKTHFQDDVLFRLSLTWNKEPFLTREKPKKGSETGTFSPSLEETSPWDHAQIKERQI